MNVVLCGVHIWLKNEYLGRMIRGEDDKIPFALINMYVQKNTPGSISFFGKYRILLWEWGV